MTERARRDEREGQEDGRVLERARMRRPARSRSPGWRRRWPMSPASGIGRRHEEHDHHPRHDQLDDHDQPARDRLGEQVDDRAVVELGADERPCRRSRRPAAGGRHAEVAEQAARDVQRLARRSGRRGGRGASTSTSSAPTSAEQQRAAPVEERAERQATRAWRSSAHQVAEDRFERLVGRPQLEERDAGALRGGGDRSGQRAVVAGAHGEQPVAQLDRVDLGPRRGARGPAAGRRWSGP